MTFPHLDQEAIRAWLGDREIAKGRPYEQGGALSRLRRQGNAIKADCQGTAPAPYRVEVEFAKRGIRTADCSCPVGAGGRCKHVAALLLAWIERPEAFPEVPTLEELLAQFDRDGLTELIKHMLERQSELETLIEITALRQNREPPTPESLRPLIRSLLGQGAHLRAHHTWGDDIFDPPSQADLDDLVDALEQHLARGEIDAAAAGFDTVAGEILEVYFEFEDEEGSLASLAQRCADGLTACLVATDPAQDARLRHTILNSMYELYCQDLELGGYGIADEVPDAIAEHGTPEERAEVATWIENVLPEEQSPRGAFETQALGRFLLTLKEDALDEEATLALLRRSGDPYTLFGKLLEFDRVDEAIDLARAMPNQELPYFANKLAAQGHAEAARRLVEARQAQKDDTRLLTWLRDHATARGDIEEALRLNEALFWRPPTLRGYQDLEQLAEPLGRWPELRRGVLDRLEREGEGVLLTDIHLHEGGVGAALERLRELGEEHVFTPGWDEPSSLAVRVAEAAEAAHPDEAAGLYQRQAGVLIEARGRTNYAEAAELLARARALRLELGQEARWASHIEQVRSENARLRALHQELSKAGL